MAFKVNLIPNREFTVIHLNQYEYGVGNTRTVAIYNGDIPFDIPSGSDITIEGVKPDGNAFAYDEGITFEDNEVTFELQDQMTVLAGQFPVEIVIRNSQGRWSTKNLIFDVEAGPVNENTPISDEDIPAYIELAQRNANRAVSAAETATSAATTATNAANTATSKASTATTAATTATTAANTATSKASTATTAASTATTAAANAKVSEDNAKDSEIIAKTAADDVRPIITEVGNVVTTENAKPEKLFYLKADLEPKQNLNGYDHPWPAGGGKNLLPSGYPTSQTKNGVTFTCNSDGTILVNGTATATTVLYLSDYTDAFENGTYILSGCPSGGADGKYGINIYTTGGMGIGKTDNGSGVQFDGRTQLVFGIVFWSGVTASNLVFKPMVRLASETDPTWEPYENICPISGYTGVTVTKTGRNILPNNAAETVTQNGVTFVKQDDGIHINGTATGNIYYNLITRNANAPTLKAGTYTLHPLASTLPNGVDLRVSDVATQTKTHIVKTTPVTFTKAEDMQFFCFLIIPSGATFSDFVVTPQLEVGTEATDYEPYVAATYPITIPTAAGTVYGGTLTVNSDGSGTLTVDMATVDLGTLNWSVVTGNNYTTFSCLKELFDAAYSASTPNILCSIYKPDANNTVSPTGDNYIWLNPQKVIRIKDTAKVGMTANEFKTAMAGQTLVYTLATPTTYALTNLQVVQMLEDKNTIWTDNSDHIEISYRNISKLNDYLDTMRGVSYDDITQAGTVTEAGTKVVDAVQLNPNVNGSIAKRLGQVETVAAAAVPKTNISRATNVTSTGSKVVDAYELNASKSGTLAKKISDNTTNITTNTNALNGFKFGFTSDTPPKPGYIVPGGADTVIPFKTGGIEILGTATGTFSQNTVFTLATNVDLSEYAFLGALEQAGKTHAYNLTEYSVGTSKLYRTHFQNDLTGTNPESTTETQFSILIPVADRTDTVTISVKNINGNSPLLTGTITLYGFKGEIEQ